MSLELVKLFDVNANPLPTVHRLPIKKPLLNVRAVAVYIGTYERDDFKTGQPISRPGRPQPADPRPAKVFLEIRRQRRLLDSAPDWHRPGRLPDPARPHDPRPAESGEVRRGLETV